jgi:hypothetical protein
MENEKKKFIPPRPDHKTEGILGALITGFVAGVASVLSLLKIFKKE